MTDQESEKAKPGYQPTPEQLAILAHRPGRHARVLAGPGTGKSATLVALVNELLGSNPAPRIRLLTFTRAATAELAKKVSEHPKAAAQRPSTVHSFALAVLLRNAGAGNIPTPIRIADDPEDREIVRPTLARLSRVSATTVNRLIAEMSANWQSLRDEPDQRVNQEERARFLGAWHQHRRIFGYTLLAELPYALRQALHDHPDLKGVGFDLLVVDEYQDLNACDLEVLSLIAQRGCSIVGAGDDDQSIYSARKAAPEGIRRFLSDYPGAADYTLSITQRCGSRIIQWASTVIARDPERPADKTPLTTVPGSPPGEVALLAFPNHEAEALGVAQLVYFLITKEGLEPSDILILLRSDYNRAFSRPIEDLLGKATIPCSDSDAINQVLDALENRRLMSVLRLVCNREDSLAWAMILRMTPGVGRGILDYLYENARKNGKTFGQAVLSEHALGLTGAPAISRKRAAAGVQTVLAMLQSCELPEQQPEAGWGHWIVDKTKAGTLPPPSPELEELVLALDSIVESSQELARFLGQVRPLGKDRALAEGKGVRIMTMAGAKGLTAKATIVAAVEEGIIPRPNFNPSEECRQLYVAMTRAREFLFCTWARQRTGPTARAGLPRVSDVRTYSTFLQGGPVESQDGPGYIHGRWKKP